MIRLRIFVALMIITAVLMERGYDNPLTEIEDKARTARGDAQIEITLQPGVRGQAGAYSVAAFTAQPAASSPAHTGAAAALPVAEVENEEFAPAHIPSSTASTVSREEIARSIALLSAFELKSEVQTQLSRLGCYNAKIDGLWGAKSRAAVEAFNEKSGENFDPYASAGLLSTLRDAPAALCSQSCSTDPGSPNACTVVASAGDVTAPINAAPEQPPSYLPPWMTGTETVDIETVRNRPDPATPQAAEVKPRRVTIESNSRTASVYSRPSRKRASKEWLPSNWPGTAR